MSNENTDMPAEIAIGQFDVVAGRDQIAQFCAAIGGGKTAAPADGDPVPVTYLMCWLGVSKIKNSIRDALLGFSGPGTIPVHLEQTIEVFRPIKVAETYRLAVFARAPDENNIARISARIFDVADNLLASLSAGVLLIDQPEGQS